MNHIFNQLGLIVPSVGAPGSIARMVSQYPTLKALKRHKAGWGLVIWYKSECTLAWVYDPELKAKYPVSAKDLIDPMNLWSKAGIDAVNTINSKNYRIDDIPISTRFILNF